MSDLSMNLQQTSGDTLAGVLACILERLPNAASVEHTVPGTVTILDGMGWRGTLTVRYGEGAVVYGPVSSIKWERV